MVDTPTQEVIAGSLGCQEVKFRHLHMGGLRETLLHTGNEKLSWNVLQVKLGIPGGEAMAAAAAEMLIPLKRIGTPDEAAGAMLMLASPYASFISGQVSWTAP